jgi:signal transduction histidine kinase
MLDKPLSGYKVAQPFRRFFPQSTAADTRSITFPNKAKLSFWNRLDGIVFNVGLNINGFPYVLSLSLGSLIFIIKIIFVVMFVIQIFVLFNSIFSGMRVIRKTLRPISELAEMTKTLNTESGDFSVAEMQALAGKLNGINAAKLDTRISLDSTQVELKNLAAAINSMLDRINESYRSQVRFVSDASHELRTPIAVIQGYANLLDRWGKNDEKTMQESIDAIKEETANMKLLVEQLLFLARGDNSTMALQMERFDLAELAEDVLRETQMIDSGHEYSANLNSVFISADEGLIKQSFRILVDNAIKYTPVGGNISISVCQKEASIWLTVQDDGIGIPDESVPKIFDRFYRSDESRARATGGTGLGLSIAKWITERHGGHLEVLSRQNVGTRISIVLPPAIEQMVTKSEQ